MQKSLLSRAEERSSNRASHLSLAEFAPQPRGPAPAPPPDPRPRPLLLLILSFSSLPSPCSFSFLHRTDRRPLTAPAAATTLEGAYHFRRPPTTAGPAAVHCHLAPPRDLAGRWRWLTTRSRRLLAPPCRRSTPRVLQVLLDGRRRATTTPRACSRRLCDAARVLQVDVLQVLLTPRPRSWRLCEVFATRRRCALAPPVSQAPAGWRDDDHSAQAPPWPATRT
jgi:hypothetical protein